MAIGRIIKPALVPVRKHSRPCNEHFAAYYTWLVKVLDSGYASTSDVLAHARVVRNCSKRDRKRAAQLKISWKTTSARDVRKAKLASRVKERKLLRLRRQMHKASVKAFSVVPTKPPKKRSGVPFFWLPAELRIAIYEMALPDSQAIDFFADVPPIAMVNRQTRAESLPIYYKYNTFTVCAGNFHKLIIWLKERCHLWVKFYEHVVIYFSHGETRDWSDMHWLEDLVCLISTSDLKLSAVDWGLLGFESSCPQDRSGRSGRFDFVGPYASLPFKRRLLYVTEAYYLRYAILHPLLRQYDLPLPLDLFLAWLQGWTAYSFKTSSSAGELLQNGVDFTTALYVNGIPHFHRLQRRRNYWGAMAKTRRWLQKVVEDLRLHGQHSQPVAASKTLVVPTLLWVQAVPASALSQYFARQ